MPEKKEEIKKEEKATVLPKQLEEIRELTLNQQIGMLSVSLNQQIQARFTNELNYRIATEAFEQNKNKSKTERDNALNGMTKAKQWIEEDDKIINHLRQLIKDLELGKIKI